MSLKKNVLFGVTALLAMSAGFWLSSIQQENSADRITDARTNATQIQGNVLSPARKIAIPALVKDNGQPFTIDDLSGQWHLLFFGYTHCPDICPTTMGVLAQAKKVAEADGQIFPGVVFVSVDPERDKVEMLGEYVRYFDSDFVGVTGDTEMIQALALQVSVVYMKIPSEAGSAGDYLVDHSSSLLLLNPEGRLQAFLNPPHEPATILHDVQRVMSQK